MANEKLTTPPKAPVKGKGYNENDMNGLSGPTCTHTSSNGKADGFKPAQGGTAGKK